MQEKNDIICFVCKSKANKSSKFCPNCGTKFIDSTKAQETDVEAQETVQEPETHNAVNLKAILEICSSLLFHFNLQPMATTEHLQISGR